MVIGQTKLFYHPDVASALAKNRPVVALESTVITHGLPYPQNVETARLMESAVRETGAVPATIAIISGQIWIGLTAEQIEFLGQLPHEAVRKCSRRDLPLALAGQEHGATTVAGTMILAHRAGISVFATGGIGGVHRGHPFDVSADLEELSRTPVTVVCSGAKSILDLPATCEVLETKGVPVLGYQTDTLPSFFSRSSGLPVTKRVETAADVAQIIRAHQQLELENGVLVTVPVPQEDALPEAYAEEVIDQAITAADAAGIDGPAATPWILAKLVEISEGRTVQANVSLLKNNGRTAGLIAVALSETN
ncbi:MAG: pseudouridine-5'-phosphate glycosidase [Ardenticatenaceae bacterium]|nr:pseudouridine-5'-phosphate glycosidase [Ardenticatenaceae bacterium]